MNFDEFSKQVTVVVLWVSEAVFHIIIKSTNNAIGM